LLLIYIFVILASCWSWLCFVKQFKMDYFLEHSLLFVFFLTAASCSFGIYSLSHLLSRRIIAHDKLTAYECGFNPFASTRITFDVHFFVVALLFLVFDVELLFLYPWALSMSYLTLFGMFAVHFFIITIIVGYRYEWKKGALNWTHKT